MSDKSQTQVCGLGCAWCQ